MKNTTGLQIGNYLYFKNTHDLAIVYLINGDKHYDCRDEYGIFIPNGNYEPIPINGQWLIDLGYTKISNNSFIISGHAIWICNDLFMCDKNGIVLKYVHQLQNLYFALTSQQLTFKK